MRTIYLVIVAAVVALLAGAASAAHLIYAPETLARSFRIESHVERRAKGPVVWGYVYNITDTTAERMVLKIDALDGSGAVSGSKTTWVLGQVPAQNRSYFETRAPEGAQYRVEVQSFEWVMRGGAL